MRDASAYEQIMTVLCLVIVALSTIYRRGEFQRRYTVVGVSPIIQSDDPNLWTWNAGKPKELTELAARSNGGTAVIPDPEPITGEHDATVVGDLIEAPAEPVLDAQVPGQKIDVFVNFTRAREQTGHNCIHVEGMPQNGVITAAQAHSLTLDLASARDAVSQIRTAAGFGS